MLLQSKLADTSMSFKDVLEIRTQVRFLVYITPCSRTDATPSFLEHEGVEGPDRAVYALHDRCGQPTTSKYVSGTQFEGRAVCAC